MNNSQVFSGNRGVRVKNDCFVSLDLKTCDGINIKLSSKVDVLYRQKIEKLCMEMMNHFQITDAELIIEDKGAFDFVLSARIEACVRQLIPEAKPFLPAFIEQNNYASTRDRMRHSRLYIPGNSPSMMINAGIYGANGIILDLEDSVAPDRKNEALLLVRNALRQVDFYGAERMVRINQLPRGLDDLKEIVHSNVHVILLPKCESGEDIKIVNSKIQSIQKENNLTGEIFLMPIIESSLGVIRSYEIATAADNVVAIAIGLEDYSADVGVERTNDGVESQFARSSLVNACKAAGVQAIDSVFSDFEDTESLKQSVQKSKLLGFEGVGCIHPNQIKIVHECFIPNESQISKAKAIVLAFEEAQKNGSGVVALGSKMIDAPVVKRAIQLIDRTIKLGKLSENWRNNDGK
ncbi:aldolase/citrate lyase family protein [Desulfocicer niacini]